jgi:hypothetical protein
MRLLQPSKDGMSKVVEAVSDGLDEQTARHGLAELVGRQGDLPFGNCLPPSITKILESRRRRLIVQRSEQTCSELGAGRQRLEVGPGEFLSHLKSDAVAPFSDLERIVNELCERIAPTIVEPAEDTLRDLSNAILAGRPTQRDVSKGFLDSLGWGRIWRRNALPEVVGDRDADLHDPVFLLLSVPVK